MGIAEWFSDFCAAIQIKREEAISRRYRAITQRLNTDYWDTTSESAHSLYVGSYGRNTAVDRTSDVDVLFQLPHSTYQQYNAHYGNGQSALLQAIRASISKTYANTELGADGQVVQVRFDDNIFFEVMPAFVNDSGRYTYPDANAGGSWGTTNPKPEIEAIRERDGTCNGNLVRLCRMMRAWKSEWNVPISGLLIDTLAYQFIIDWPHRDKSFLYYDFICRDFFAHMAAQSEAQERWIAPGSGQYVYAQKGQFQYKATRCRNIAIEAIEHETATPRREWSAKQKWKDIFGTAYFT